MEAGGLVCACALQAGERSNGGGGGGGGGWSWCAQQVGEGSHVCVYLLSGARAPGDLPGTRDSGREEGAGERVHWQSHS